MDDPDSGSIDTALHRSATSHRSVALLACVGFAIPIGAYFWFIHHYALNIIRTDQWSDIQLIAKSYSGHLSFADLWAPHYENRILFPNLFVLLLSRTTNLNILVEEYLSAAMLVASAGLVIFAHRRRVGLAWICYCPVAILMLSFVQHENTLWGFQLAWYLVLLAAAATFTLLDRPILTWWWLTASVGAAVVASYSSLQGLIVWPTGLLLLYYRNRPRSFAIAWICAATVTVALYFLNFAPGSDYVVGHPFAALQFYFVAIGDVVGVYVSGTGATATAILVLGLVLFAVSIWVLVAYCRGRDETSGLPLAAALITFGLVFAGLVTIGSIKQGLPGASSSRYRTFDLLILVGLYLAVLDVFALRRSARESSRPRGTLPEATSSVVGNTGGKQPQRVFVALAAVVALIVGLQIAIGVPQGLAGGRTDHTNQVLAGRVEANLDGYPGGFALSVTAPLFSIGEIRQLNEAAQRRHLSLFATDAAAKYRAEGPIADTSPLATRISLPKPDAVLKGGEILSATSIDYFVTKVQFEITGVGLKNAVLLTAEPYTYGWIALWRTTTVPNGSYLVQSIAYTAAGRVARSAEVSVVVKNA